MPRTKKDNVLQTDIEEEKNIKGSVAKKTTSKASAKTKKSTTEKENSKASTRKASASKTTAKSKSTNKTTSTKSKSSSDSTSTKGKTTSKSASKKNQSTSKTSATKTAKASTKKAASKTSKSVKAKTTSKTKKTTTKKPKIEVVEYYDLPYRYNQTVVKILYQTPTTLFIYWDISDVDRENFVKQYGNNFFNDTKPVLIVHNDTLHYSFEIEINDFANSWYLHVNDANCKYAVELGRRPKYYNSEKHINIPNDYLYVTYSNEIEAPNDHVLFNKNMDTVYFKDVKTNIVTAESITSLSFIRNMGKIYSLFDLQTSFNKNDWLNSDHWQLDLNNPSSGNPSSTFK